MTLPLPDDRRLKLLNSDDVYRVMQDILLREESIDQDKEHFWMIGLATNNTILYIELVSLGSVNATVVEPMNVFRVAVLKNASKVIITHNHPSGELRPSEADKDITDRLIQVGRILNIEVIDHLVISTTSFMSFTDTGLFAQLQQSTKWVPQFELIERIRKEQRKLMEEAIQLEKDKALRKVVRAEAKAAKQLKAERQKMNIKKAKQLKAEKEKAAKKIIAIAKRALKKGLSIEMVSQLTGLSREEIKKLK